MWRAGGIMALSRYLLLLFLLALQAQNAQSAPAAGQGAVADTESALSAPELEADSMLIPSWYLKQKNYDTVPEGFPEGFPDVAEELLTALDEAPSETDSETLPETLPVEESNSVPGTDEETKAIRDTSTLAEPEEYAGSAAGQKVETPGQWKFIKKYLLASVAVSALLLPAAVVVYIVVYQLRKRDMRAQEDIEAPAQDWDSSRESCGLPQDETESGEGAGSSERAQANGFRDSCRLFPEIFAAELAQLYQKMRADPAPLTTCPYCALAEGATSRDCWISLESPQPTASWCPCKQYQEEYFMFEDEDD